MTPTLTQPTTTTTKPSNVVPITHACGHQCAPTYTGTADDRPAWIAAREAKFCRACSRETAQAIAGFIDATEPKIQIRDLSGAHALPFGTRLSSKHDNRHSCIYRTDEPRLEAFKAANGDSITIEYT